MLEVIFTKKCLKSQLDSRKSTFLNKPYESYCLVPILCLVFEYTKYSY